MLPVLLVLALGIWLLGAGAVRVFTRYEHTARSKFVLIGLIPLAVLAGYWIAARYFPRLDTGFFWPVAIALSVPSYIIMVVVLVEIWRLALQAAFEKKIYSLSEREARCQQELEMLRRLGHGESDRRERDEALKSERRSHRQVLRNRVEHWKQEGSSVRVRTLKVEQWERELAGASREDLLNRARRIELEIMRMKEGGTGDIRQAEACLNLVLFYLEQEEDARSDEEVSQRLQGIGMKEDEVYGELATVRRDLEVWRRKREEFLKQRITLT